MPASCQDISESFSPQSVPSIPLAAAVSSDLRAIQHSWSETEDNLEIALIPSSPTLLTDLTLTETGNALAQCLQESDCIMVQRHSPRECLSDPHVDQLPMRCQQLRKGFSECKRGLIDMRKRFRGNQPISVSTELEGGSSNKSQQLYAGKPAFESVKEISGDEVKMDPEKTRGL